ncbi:unnamed protein product [Cuscuta europaea]|uniref:Uncharacterized protein n=1 Tax=Cuscuta europaea TaxID=41803 RepID=A0A9P0ZG31_CUSEU|nr:unnamed protein product [Cuscuta europaea]
MIAACSRQSGSAFSFFFFGLLIRQLAAHLPSLLSWSKDGTSFSFFLFSFICLVFFVTQPCCIFLGFIIFLFSLIHLFIALKEIKFKYNKSQNKKVQINGKNTKSIQTLELNTNNSKT